MAQKFKGDVRVDGALKLNGRNGTSVLQTDASGNITESTITTTELGYLTGVSSNVQDQLDDKINSTEKGANNGVATLDGGGKIPAAQLPNSVMEYKGNWDASSNSPTLADGVGNAGDVYRVNTAGTQDLGSGSQTFAVGDWVVYNGSIWEKSINSNAVVSVNGQSGIVTLDTDDISEGTALYFTDERAQDAIGTILVDSASIDFTYDDGTPSITASVIPGGVDHDQLLNFVANEHVDHSTVSIATAANTSGLTGGGDITATRNLSVDINGTTAETSADNADKILIYDNSASALKSMTRANFLSGIPTSSAGDIPETNFSGSEDVNSPADVTGLAFNTATVRSFVALISVYVNATSSVYEAFEIKGIQKDSSWDIAISSVGDDSSVGFSITSGGQIRYTSADYDGFVSLTMKFRAITTSV